MIVVTSSTQIVLIHAWIHVHTGLQWILTRVKAGVGSSFSYKCDWKRQRKQEQSTWVVVSFLFILLGSYINKIKRAFCPDDNNIWEALGKSGSAGWVEPGLHIFLCLVEELGSAPLVSPCVLMTTWRQAPLIKENNQDEEEDQIITNYNPSQITYNVLDCSLIPFSVRQKQMFCSKLDSNSSLSPSRPDYLLWASSWSGFSRRAGWQRLGSPPPPRCRWRASEAHRRRWPSSTRKRRM